MGTHSGSTGHHEVDATETNKLPQYMDIRFNKVLIEGGGRINIDGLDAAHRLGVSFHNVVAEQPDLIHTSVDHADIELDGSNISFSGDDVRISGKPSKGIAYTCRGKFVPFPVPISTM